MKRLSKHIAALLCLTSLTLAASCSATDELNETQTQSIVSYLGKLPRNEGTDPMTLGDSLYIVTDGVYKYIAAESEEPDSPIVREGDRISFYFDIRVFSNGPSAAPVFTNIPELIEQYGMAEWAKYADATITVGSGEIILGNGETIGMMKAVENALPGCQAGSQVDLIFPSRVLFDKNAAGPIEADTPLMYRIIITDIIPPEE